MLDPNAPIPEFLSLELPLEDKFQLRRFRDDMANMQREELEKLLLDTLRQLMAKDRVIKQLMKGQMEALTYKHDMDGLKRVLWGMARIIGYRAKKLLRVIR